MSSPSKVAAAVFEGSTRGENLCFADTSYKFKFTKGKLFKLALFPKIRQVKETSTHLY